MFSILLVLLVFVVWAFSAVARAAQRAAESPVFDKARDHVSKANGAYHQHKKEVKFEAAKLYVHAKHELNAVRAWRERRAS